MKKSVQDTYGFIWLATQDGLTRFDGKNSTVFNTPVLAGNDVSDLYIDSTSKWLWVSYSRGGVDAIDTRTLDVRFSLHGLNCYKTLRGTAIRSVVCNDGKELWIGTENGLYFMPEFLKDSLVKMVLPTAATKPAVIGLEKQRLGDILAVVSGYGVVRIARQTHVFTTTVFNNPADVYKVTQDKPGQKLACATSAGVFIYFIETGRLIPAESLYGFSFSNKVAIAALFHGDDLYISNLSGLYKITHPGGLPQKITFNYLQQSALNNIATNLLVDRQNNIWIGTMVGCYYAPIRDIPFQKVSSTSANKPANHLYDLFYHRGKLLACDETGLYRFDPATASLAVLDGKKIYHYFFVGPSGKVICNNNDGNFFYDFGRERLEGSIDLTYPEFHPYTNTIFTSAINVGDSVVLLASIHKPGIFQWDIRARKIFYTDTGFEGQRSIGPVYALCRLSKSTALVGSGSFLLFYDISKRVFRQVTTKAAEASYFFDLLRLGDHFLIASYGNGITVTDNTLTPISHFNTSNGLSNNCVYKLLPENDSTIWASSNNGLNRINIKSGEITTFFAEDGLHGNEFEQFSGTLLAGGRLCFGGLKGMTVINPNLFKRNLIPPTLYLTGVNIDIANKGDDIKFTDIEQKDIDIPAWWLQATLTFTALNLSNPARINYQYRILEKGDAWTSLPNGKLTLVGLGPGGYHFEVRASNENNVWSAPLSLALFVHYKWFETAIFKLTVLLAILAFLFGIYRFRLSQLKKQGQIRKDIAADLHDDIGGTLNSVKVYAHLAESSAEKQPYFDRIRVSIGEATTGLRDIIWVLDDKDDSVLKLVERIGHFARPLCNALNISLSFNTDPAAYQKRLTKKEKKNLLLISKEAINNAVKYAECSAIQVTVKLEKGKISINIRDNGKGFQMNGGQAGNGLNNMRLRAAQIGCEIDIHSAKSSGTDINVHHREKYPPGKVNKQMLTLIRIKYLGKILKSQK